MSQEGTHVEPEATLDHRDTNTSYGHTQTIPNGHSTLEPIHTQRTPHIQAKDPKTSENHKEPKMKKKTKHKNP